MSTQPPEQPQPQQPQYQPPQQPQYQAQQPQYQAQQPQYQTLQHSQHVVYQQVVKPPTNGMAITSLVLGIVGIAIGIWSIIPVLGIVAAFISFLPALLAVIFGHVGLKAVVEKGVGRGQALTGLILGYITIAIIVLVTVFWIFAMVASAGTATLDYS